MELRWHILGAGAVGQLLACKLLRAGIPAQLLCRDTSAARVFDRGVELLEGSTTERLPVSATSPDQLSSIAALFITTKANQASAAFQQVRYLLQADTPVVLLHNGMGVYEQLAPLFPARNLYCGTTTEAAYREEHARLVVAGRGETRIGQYGEESPPDWFSGFASSSEGFLWERDIDASLWRKLLINCAINPLTAVYRCRNGELLANPEYRQQAILLCAELAAVCRARGEETLAEQVQEIAFGVMRSTAQNQSSMLRDVLHGRPTEIEFITGYLCRQAHVLKVPCPINTRLLELLR